METYKGKKQIRIIIEESMVKNMELSYTIVKNKLFLPTYVVCVLLFIKGGYYLSIMDLAQLLLTLCEIFIIIFYFGQYIVLKNKMYIIYNEFSNNNKKYEQSQ